MLSDDDHDGVAEEHTFLTGIPDVHALALGPGYLYYTTQSTVFRTPYVVGQRAASAPSEDLKLPATYRTGGRWTHGLALSPGGHLITSRGEYGMCGSAPMSGEISTINPDGSLEPLATGFRNPMYMRCHRTDEVCAATELGEDLLSNAHEKMLMIHPNTNYGFPCCTTTATPISGAESPALCGDVTKEDATFPLSFTPFGFDWEPGNWPAPYKNAVFVAQHGSAYSSPAWQGAGIVFATTDPTTHAPSQPWQAVLAVGVGPGRLRPRAARPTRLLARTAGCSSPTTRAAASSGWRRRRMAAPRKLNACGGPPRVRVLGAGGRRGRLACAAPFLAGPMSRGDTTAGAGATRPDAAGLARDTRA